MHPRNARFLSLAVGVVFAFSLLGSAPVQAASITASQIQAILTLLSAFGADAGTVANVQAALENTPAPSVTQTVPSSVPAPSTNSTSTGTTSGGSCSVLSVTLRFGATDRTTGGAVSRLQRFLGKSPSIYPSGSVTGYFGVLTLQAVQRWQAAQGIVSYGTPASTGYGEVGPRTLQKINGEITSACATANVPAPTTPAPSSAGSGSGAGGGMSYGGGVGGGVSSGGSGSSYTPAPVQTPPASSGSSSGGTSASGSSNTTNAGSGSTSTSGSSSASASSSSGSTSTQTPTSTTSSGSSSSGTTPTQTTLISNLVVNDTANAANWSIRNNLQNGDLAYGDRTTLFTSMPAVIAGSDWIRPANWSKTYTGATLVTFTIGADSDVYVAHNNAISPKPSWMSTWTNTGITVTSDAPLIYTLYKKSFPGGSTVSLGNNGHTSYSTYFIVVKKSATPATPPAAPNCTLTATAASITAGNSSTLSWTTSNATSFSVNNGVGTQTSVSSGSTSVSPSTTTTYTGTATGAGGTVHCAATVTAAPVSTTPSSTSSTPVTTAGFPAAQPVNLCQGYPTNNRSMVNYSTLAKPQPLVPVMDPDFTQTKIVRVTDVAKWWGSSVATPVYPTIQAWNSNENYMVLYVTNPITSNGIAGQWGLFDGHSYKFLSWLPINPADVEQFYWSTTNPNDLYYVDNHQSGSTNYDALTMLDVSTGVQTVIHDFAPDMKSGGQLYGICPYGGLKVSGGEDPFSMSENNTLIGLGCYLQKNGPGGSAAYSAFSYNLSTGKIGKTFTVEADVPQALPSGTGTYFYKDTTQVFTLDALMNQIVKTLPFDGSQHSDLLRLSNGDDAIAGAQFDGPSGSGTLMWADLTKGGPVHTIIGQSAGDPYPPTGTLVSGRAYKNPGWVAVGITGCVVGTNGDCGPMTPVAASNPQTYLDQEILLANLDTGAFCRVAHDRTTGNWSNASQSNYWAQPNVTISPSGTRILFDSDWGAGNPKNPSINPNAPVDTYVLELPSYSPPAP